MNRYLEFLAFAFMLVFMAITLILYYSMIFYGTVRALEPNRPFLYGETILFTFGSLYSFIYILERLKASWHSASKR